MSILQRPPINNFSDLRLPPTRSLILDNGIRLVILDRDTCEVSRITAVLAGGTTEATNLSCSVLTCQLMSEGTMLHPDGSNTELLDFHGARMTINPTSHFMMLQMSMTNSHHSEVLPVMAETMLRPQLSPTSFEVIKNRLAEHYRVLEHRVEHRSQRDINRLAMGESHPHGRYDTPEDVEALTIDDIRQYHMMTCTPSRDNITLFLTGRISPEIEDNVNKLFSSIPISDTPAVVPDIRPYTPMAPQRIDTSVQGALQSGISMAIPTIGSDHPDYIKLRLVTMAFGGYFSSRLMKNIREDKGYTYGIQSSLPMQPEGGVIYIRTSADNAYVEPVIMETISEMHRMAIEPFPADELERFRRYAISGLASLLDTPFDTMDFYIRQHCNFGNPDFFNKYFHEANTLTADTIMDISSRYLRPELLRIAVAGAQA